VLRHQAALAQLEQASQAVAQECIAKVRDGLVAKMDAQLQQVQQESAALVASLPALKPRKVPAPMRLMMASAMIERAELATHRNRTL
jgi:hypothetical protein